MDAITLLIRDHRAVKTLFEAYEAAGEGAARTKRGLAKKIIHELAIHTSVEEMFLYPLARRASDEMNKLVLEALEEHHLAKGTLSELEKMEPKDERFDAKMTVLMESVRHHINEEEAELFPRLRQALGRADLNELGAAMMKSKKRAPTHPHPMAPDSPPANVITTAVAKVIDAGRDLFDGEAHAAERSAAALVHAIQDRASDAPRRAGSAVRSLKRGVASARRSASETVRDVGRASVHSAAAPHGRSAGHRHGPRSGHGPRA